MEMPKFLKRILPFYNHKKRLSKRFDPKKVRIALDESIGFAKTQQIKGYGYEIVCIARHAEKDVSWLNRAFAAGALFVVSPDLDIPNLIEKENYPMIWIDYLHVPTNSTGGKHWAIYVDKRIQAKIEFLKNQFGGEK